MNGGKIAMPSHVASAILAAAFVLAPVVAGTAPASSKTPFTVTNDPVHNTVVDAMQQRTCTGTIAPTWSWIIAPYRVQAIFYRKPDGTKWVKFYHKAIGPQYLSVTEVGVSAQWNIIPPDRAAATTWYTHYAVWPQGDNRLSGITVDPWGTIDLACTTEPLEQPVQ